ncbi:MAG TPA: hypothetical protein VNN22_03900 [Verrucomicrobiae bacterium]|nr:hypothetical protein [Verrucomicrobiae bacterium]
MNANTETPLSQANGKNPLPPMENGVPSRTCQTCCNTSSNSNYHGRIKVNGKTIRETLNTDAWSIANTRLHDLYKKHPQDSARFEARGSMKP